MANITKVVQMVCGKVPDPGKKAACEDNIYSNDLVLSTCIQPIKPISDAAAKKCIEKMHADGTINLFAAVALTVPSAAPDAATAAPSVPTPEDIVARIGGGETPSDVDLALLTNVYIETLKATNDDKLVIIKTLQGDTPEIKRILAAVDGKAVQPQPAPAGPATVGEVDLDDSHVDDDFKVIVDVLDKLTAQSPQPFSKAELAALYNLTGDSPYIREVKRLIEEKSIILGIDASTSLGREMVKPSVPTLQTMERAAENEDEPGQAAALLYAYKKQFYTQANSILKYFDSNDTARKQLGNPDLSAVGTDVLKQFKGQQWAENYAEWARDNQLGDTKDSDYRTPGEVEKDLLTGLNEAIEEAEAALETAEEAKDSKLVKSLEERIDAYKNIRSLVGGAYQGNFRVTLGFNSAAPHRMRLSPGSLGLLNLPVDESDPVQAEIAEQANEGKDTDFAAVNLTPFLGDKILTGLVPVLGFEFRGDSWRWGGFSLFGRVEGSYARYESRRDDKDRTGYAMSEYNVKMGLTGLYDTVSGAGGVLRAGARLMPGVLYRDNNYGGTPVGSEREMDNDTYDKVTPTLTGEGVIEYQPWKNFTFGLNGSLITTFEQTKQYLMSQGGNVAPGDGDEGEQGKIQDFNIRNRFQWGIYFLLNF